MPSRPTFLFDADCGFCTSLKAVASFLDASHRVDFLPIHEAARSGLLSTIPESEWYSCSRMLSLDGSITGGGDAVVDLLSFLPGGKLPALMISRVPLGLPTSRALYGVVSRLHSYSCSTAHPASRVSAHTTAWSSI